MGMAASQARLLSITARMTDNEHSGQAVSYSKIRLADQTEEASREYTEALKATKLTVLTGFNGPEEIYTDISYNLMTGYNTVANNMQYVVTNKNGAVLVTSEQADAFEAGNGDYNIFLAKLGYSQANIEVNNASTREEDRAAKALAYKAIHEAWDKYLTSVGLHIGEDEEHGLNFGYVQLPNSSGAVEPMLGYPTYTVIDLSTGIGETKPLNFEGTTLEQREFYDYACALTEAFYGTSSSATTLETAANPSNEGKLQYLKNIFQKMATCGYTTEYDENKTLKDNKWFEQQLKDGNLLLEYYSAKERKFVSTSIDSDQSIQEVTDERKIAIIEQDYKNKLEKLEAKDNRYDLELKKLDTEHNALQTEYQVLKGVIDKNVQESFKIFSA